MIDRLMACCILILVLEIKFVDAHKNTTTKWDTGNREEWGKLKG
jgi:hypothetical protein